MSFDNPPGWSQRCTMRDDYAMHQIRINNVTSKGVVIGCTCASKPIAFVYLGEDVMRAWRDAEHQPQAVRAA